MARTAHTSYDGVAASCPLSNPHRCPPQLVVRLSLAAFNLVPFGIVRAQDAPDFALGEQVVLDVAREEEPGEFEPERKVVHEGSVVDPTGQFPVEDRRRIPGNDRE